MKLSVLRATAGFAALTVTTFGAQAADLGGNCCADLEERIAELEATTARKGNRKLSLEVYGQINESILHWDDGGEANTYIVTNDNARSRFGFRGKAKINGEWEAGYRIEIGVRIANSKRFTQDDARGPADNVGLDLRDSNWYLKSKTLGAVYVGLGTTATNAISEINLSQTALFSKYSDVEDSGLGLRLRDPATGGLSAITWRRLLGDGGDQPGEGERALNVVRYESPTWNGFAVGSSWGEDDLWDVALRYSGEFSGFKLAAGIGYGEVTDNVQTQSLCAADIPGGGPSGSDTSCHQLGGSVSIMHDPTGLFVNVAAGTKTDDLLNETVIFSGTGADDTQDFWALQGGIEKAFNAFGKTTVYGEYYDYNGGANERRTIGATDPLSPFAGASAIWSTGLEMYGAGIAQGFDSAALILYLSYRHYEADLTARQLVGGVATGSFADVPLEDLDVVLGGGVIKF